MKRLLPIVITLAGAALWAAPRLSTSPSPSPAQTPHAVAPREPPYRSEQEWIVREVVRGILAGTHAARGTGGTLPNDIIVRTRAASAVDLLTAATFDVTVDGERQPPVTVDAHVWAAPTYVPLAKGLLGGDGGAASEQTTDDGWTAVEALTDPDVPVILREEARVSRVLAAEPRRPSAHEDAALLTAVLALRETPGLFSDVRSLQSRTAAHLALARALSGDPAPGPSGRLAAIIVSALAGREDLALGDLDRWHRPDMPPAAAAWRRALRLRITGDWRSASMGPGSSRLERLEYARALRARVSASRLLDYFDEQTPDAGAEWHRIVLHGGWYAFTVEAGNRFVEAGFDREFAEIEQVWRAYHDGQPSLDQLIASLNDEQPQGARAIDWPTWAASLQRHLCAHLTAQARHLRNRGLEDRMAEYASDTKKTFGVLRLLPFVLRSAARDAPEYKASVDAARATQIARADLVTPQLATLMRARPYFEHQTETFPSDVAWFTPHVPTGTAFDLVNRTLAPGCERPVPLEQVAKWVVMTPSDMWTRWSLVWLRAPGRPEFAAVQEALGRLPEYDLRASQHMFDELGATQDQYLWAARHMCQVDVDECDRLGAQLLQDGREAEALNAFDAYANRARDSVGVSNTIKWLVRRHWELGNHTRAIALATAAGATGSASGLELQGDILERSGRADDAEALYASINERYRDAGAALAGFYLRKARVTRDTRWVERAALLVPRDFPKGFEPADPAWLSAPPPDGMTFLTFGTRAIRTGLRATDIVAALDGYRVRSVAQYQVLARGSDDPVMRFIVWRDGRFQPVNANVPERWLGVVLTGHPSTRPVQVPK